MKYFKRILSLSSYYFDIRFLFQRWNKKGFICTPSGHISGFLIFSILARGTLILKEEYSSGLLDSSFEHCTSENLFWLRCNINSPSVTSGSTLQMWRWTSCLEPLMEKLLACPVPIILLFNVLAFCWLLIFICVAVVFMFSWFSSICSIGSDLSFVSSFT